MNNEDDWTEFTEAAEEIDRLRKERKKIVREILEHGYTRKLSDLEWFDKPAKPKENPAPRQPAMPLERYVVRRLELSRRGWRR